MGVHRNAGASSGVSSPWSWWLLELSRELLHSLNPRANKRMILRSLSQVNENRWGFRSGRGRICSHTFQFRRSGSKSLSGLEISIWPCYCSLTWILRCNESKRGAFLCYTLLHAAGNHCTDIQSFVIVLFLIPRNPTLGAGCSPFTQRATLYRDLSMSIRPRNSRYGQTRVRSLLTIVPKVVIIVCQSSTVSIIPRGCDHRELQDNIASILQVFSDTRAEGKHVWLSERTSQAALDSWCWVGWPVTGSTGDRIRIPCGVFDRSIVDFEADTKRIVWLANHRTVWKINQTCITWTLERRWYLRLWIGTGYPCICINVCLCLSWSTEGTKLLIRIDIGPVHW